MRLNKLQKTAVTALEDIKARDIEVLDVRKLTSICDTLVIATAESARQTKALASHVRDKLKASGADDHRRRGRGVGRMGAGRRRRHRRPHHAAGGARVLQPRGTVGSAQAGPRRPAEGRARRRRRPDARRRARAGRRREAAPGRAGPPDAGLGRGRRRRLRAAAAAGFRVRAGRAEAGAARPRQAGRATAGRRGGAHRRRLPRARGGGAGRARRRVDDARRWPSGSRAGATRPATSRS